jgi:hypothetical protein
MTADIETFPLRLVDGRRLERRYRDVLLPGGVLCDHAGQARVLPRYFYEIESWEQASRTLLAPHFAASEFIHTDAREAPPLRVFPRYIPCATVLLALALELFRQAVGTYVFIGANGGQHLSSWRHVPRYAGRDRQIRRDRARDHSDPVDSSARSGIGKDG